MKSRLTPIAFAKLPSRARASISPTQRSYIDEFHFYKVAHSLDIEAWYAGMHLATWDGKRWSSPIFLSSKT